MPWNNHFAPVSSETAKKMAVGQVKETFEGAGFTNVQLVKIERQNGWWYSTSTAVDHVSFAGKTTFTTDDYCEKSASVIIYYRGEITL